MYPFSNSFGFYYSGKSNLLNGSDDFLSVTLSGNDIHIPVGCIRDGLVELLRGRHQIALQQSTLISHSSLSHQSAEIFNVPIAVHLLQQLLHGIALRQISQSVICIVDFLMDLVNLKGKKLLLFCH